MTELEVSLHYLNWAADKHPGKSRAAREARLLAAFDQACRDVAQLLAERESAGGGAGCSTDTSVFPAQNKT